MKSLKSIQISLVSIIAIIIAAYIVYAMTVMSDGKNEKCESLIVTIDNPNNTSFLTVDDIEERLHQCGIYPQGLSMKKIDVRKITESLKDNPFIATAQCYKTGNGKVVLKVHQRTPVLYVLPDRQTGYYVDAEGTIIQNDNYPVNLLVATGNIDRRFATTALNSIGEYISKDDFLNNQIEQIVVRVGHDNHYLIDLVPRVGQQEIHLGSINNYASKLKRLKTFYNKAITSIGWNKYTTINLEYDNQVICRKNKKASTESI